MFGAISSNKENIIVFIAMLKSLRFTFDHEELVMVTLYFKVLIISMKKALTSPHKMVINMYQGANVRAPNSIINKFIVRS